MGRTLTLKLIGILLNLPLTSACVSKNGESPLGGDIAFLHVHLSSNQTKFKHATELVPMIQTHGLLCRGYRTDKTPIRHPTTSLQSSTSFVGSFQQTLRHFNTGRSADTSNLRRNVDLILKGEFENNLIIDYPELFNKLFDGVL